MSGSSTEGIKTVLHPVSDVDKAKKVYAALLGVQPQHDAGYYVGFEAEGQHIGLVPGGGPQEMTSMVGFRDGAFRSQYAAKKIHLSNLSRVDQVAAELIRQGPLLLGRELEAQIRDRAADGELGDIAVALGVEFQVVAGRKAELGETRALQRILLAELDPAPDLGAAGVEAEIIQIGTIEVDDVVEGDLARPACGLAEAGNGSIEPDLGQIDLDAWRRVPALAEALGDLDR